MWTTGDFEEVSGGKKNVNGVRELGRLVQAQMGRRPGFPSVALPGRGSFGAYFSGVPALERAGNRTHRSNAIRWIGWRDSV